MLASVIENATGLLSLFAELKGISVVLNTVESLGVYADKQMIGIIVRNLLSNAIKFSNESEMVIVTPKADAEYWSVSIRDEGVGISKKM